LLDARDTALMPSPELAEDTSMAVSPSNPPVARTSFRLLRGLGDEQLTQLVANGSGPAFAVIYDRYMPALLRYCRRILGSADDAEDAAQAAMVSAMRGLGQRPPRRLRPWLYRIAHNEAISLARRQVHSEPLSDLAEHSAGPDPEQAAATRARLAQLLSDLHALPGRQRDALVMRELCGRSYTDIATELGSSEAAAQQAVFEARLSLHEFGKGRDLDCVEIQRSMSAFEHARLRSRRIRAHLRTCECCVAFERDLYARRRDFALLLPWVGATTVPEILGLAGGGAARTLTRVLRTPLPPGGLRSVAVAAFAAALGATGLGLQAVSGAPHQSRGAASARADLRFSSPGEQASTTTSGGAPGTARAPVAHAHAPGRKPSATPGASEGGQMRVPARQAPTGGDAASGGSAAPARGGPSATGGGRLPVQTPRVGQALGTPQTLGAGAVNGATGAVNAATGAVQNTVATAGQTVTGATGTVKSTVQSAGDAAQHLVNSLP
jgi:RNA polymerase sigma factor (sigma-70 family)